MKIEKLVVGQLQTNCYLVWDEKSKEAVIIDPGDDAGFIINKIQDYQLRPKLILATHGHFDHVLATTELKLAFGIPFLMHQADLPILKRIQSTTKYFLGREADPAPKVDKFLKGGEQVDFGKESLKVIETPGHSPGGVAFYAPGILFSGDTLFKQGVGRTDLAYSSTAQLNNSLKKLFQLPEKTVVYPGHGPKTTINAAEPLA